MTFWRHDASVSVRVGANSCIEIINYSFWVRHLDIILLAAITLTRVGQFFSDRPLGHFCTRAVVITF